MRQIRNFAGPLLTAALLLGGAAAVQAQAPGQDKGVSLSKVERKNRAPVSKEVLQVKLPRATEATLSNGLTVLILEDHRRPLVYAQLNLSGAGSLFEPTEMPGLASLTAQMLREGTKTRTSKQIAEESDTLGASINASAAFGSAATGLNANGLSDNFDAWFSLAVDLLLNPAFPEDELAKLKQRTRAQLVQQRGFPGFLAEERFRRAIYGSHAASRIATTAEALEKITPAVLAAWHKERYAPQNAILGFAGDVSAKEILPKLEKWLGGWAKTDLKEMLPADAEPAAGKKIYVVDRPASVQTNLVAGNLAINRRDPDYIPLVVMNRVLGEGPASRLFLNLREEKGYTYGVYSGFQALKHRGHWNAGGSLRTEVTDGAMAEFMKEFQRIREEKVPAAELEEAERAVVASFALSLEQATQLLFYSVIRKIYGFPDDYWDTYPAKVLGVTPEEVQRVARKYVDLDRMQVVAVGDGSKIKAVMEKYGPVELYDAEGKPVEAKAAGAAPGR